MAGGMHQLPGEPMAMIGSPSLTTGGAHSAHDPQAALDKVGVVFFCNVQVLVGQVGVRGSRIPGATIQDPEISADGVGGAHHIPKLVNNGDVGGGTAFRRGGGQLLKGEALPGNKSGVDLAVLGHVVLHPLLGVLLGDQGIDGQLIKIRVPEVGDAIRHAQPQSLVEGEQIFRGVEAHRDQVVVLQDIEHLQHGGAAVGGRAWVTIS